MLKQRIITALFLIPLVIWAIYSLSAQNFSYVLALLLLISSTEWNSFVIFSNKISGWIFSLLLTFSFIYIEYSANTQVIQIVIYLSLFWWLLSLPLLFSFPFKATHLLQQKPVKVLVGFIMLLATFLALNVLRNSPQYGPNYVMYLLLMIWLADSGAYFAGRAWGKHKLIPNVSPGKTWEGVAGGIMATLIAALIAVYVIKLTSFNSMLFILLTLITVVYSVIGDLSESMFKRMANVKDSGNILPGHGGILDRIDSLTSGLPVFVAGLWLLEYFA